MDFESAGANGVVGIDAEEAEIEEQAAADVGFLSTEAVLAAPQSVGDVRREDLAKGIFVAVKDARVIAVLELEERRMPQHCRLYGWNMSKIRMEYAEDESGHPAGRGQFITR